MESFEAGLTAARDLVWGWPLIILLLGTHVFLTVRLGFVQRYLPRAIRFSLGRSSEGEGDVSQFGSLMTALAATVGTGNIVGVATAVAIGGPGAVFWMWITGVLGIATKYAEAVLAVKYRVVTASGEMAGGPMYVLERGLGLRWLAAAFAFCTAVTAFFVGNMVQANSIAEMLEGSAAVSRWVTGGVLALLTALVILGGIRSIARVCAALVPVMALGYICGCVALLAAGWRTLPQSLALIISSAFTGHAAVGGFAGAALIDTLRIGVARGLFSNESGLGSAPIVAAAAKTKSAVQQGLVSATGTFWDTVVVCLLTGLVLVNSGAWQVEGLDGGALSRAAFTAQFPRFGSELLTFALLTFVFSTILGWCYYGEKAVEYLWGRSAVPLYRRLWVAALIPGSLLSLSTVWTLADICNAGMAFPNLVALLALSGVAAEETRRHLWGVCRGA